jgi:thioredoxin 1
MSDELADVTRADVTAHRGPLLLEFGATWCGYCRALAPIVDEVRAAFPQVEHWKMEDGPGRPLGRSFRVTLWPTLVFLHDGQVIRQIVRPGRSEVLEGFRALTLAEPGVASDRASIRQIERSTEEATTNMNEHHSGPRDGRS